MDKKRILIIGARGFLGTYAAQAAQSSGVFHVLHGDRFRNEPDSPSSVESETEAVALDIADAASVDRAFRQTRPDCALLLAAISDIDRCEASPETAQAINTRGAEHVANACARYRTRLLFTSSAAVFDGARHGYAEDDAPAPISVYGMSKLAAEQAVLRILPSAIILRFALALGFARRRGASAMLDSLMATWHAGEPVFLSTVEERNPIDAATLSRIMLHLIADPGLTGIYHAGASDSLSRYELGLGLAAHAGVSAHLVRPQTRPVPGRAPRGRHHHLLTGKLERICSIEVGNSQQVMERCFA